MGLNAVRTTRSPILGDNIIVFSVSEVLQPLGQVVITGICQTTPRAAASVTKKVRKVLIESGIRTFWEK